MGIVRAAVVTTFGAAGTAVSTGPDLAGIALVITAVSGLIATVGALIIALRRKPGTEGTDLALKLLAAQVERMNKPEDDKP